MTDFYIFRHGDTIETGNFLLKIFGRHHDSHTISILSKGKLSLLKIGKYLKGVKISRGYSSPYLRCRESINIVGKESGIKFVTDDRLNELEGGGENFKQFEERVKSFLNEIKKKKYQNIVICTHGAVMAAIKHLETNGKFNRFQIFDYPEPGKLEIIKESIVKTIDFNN